MKPEIPYFSVQFALLKHKSRLGLWKILCSLLQLIPPSMRKSIPDWLWKYFKGLQEHGLCDHQKKRKIWEPNWEYEYGSPSAVVSNLIPLLPVIAFPLQIMLLQENKKTLNAVNQPWSYKSKLAETAQREFVLARALGAEVLLGLWGGGSSCLSV